MTKKEYLQEAKACREAAAIIEKAVNRAKAAAEKDELKKQQGIEKLISTYGTLEEAEEAFAYGSITRKEYDRIRDKFEGLEQKAETSHKRAVHHILKNFYNKLLRDADYFEQEANKG